MARTSGASVALRARTATIGAYERAPATTTHVTANPNPSVQGQNVPLCATVAAVVSGIGTPTGIVTFRDGATTLGTGTLVNGSLRVGIASLSVGSSTLAHR